jgi:hypothetical protein
MDQLFNLWWYWTKDLSKPKKQIADFIAETVVVTALVFSLSMFFLGLLHQVG